MKELTTERLLLRAFVESDWQAVHEYASDPEVVQYMPWGPNTEDETRRFIDQRLADQAVDHPGHVEYAVALRAEDRLIGGCGVHASDNPDNSEGWIGYCLNPRYWGRGYATEAARTVLGFGFREFGFHRIFATCDPRNAGSRRVLKKIGMRREGRLREHKWQKGEWRDSLLYAILEHEWSG